MHACHFYAANAVYARAYVRVSLCVHIYIYIYIYMCVCVCACVYACVCYFHTDVYRGLVGSALPLEVARPI